jgi:hypothetical protein
MAYTGLDKALRARVTTRDAGGQETLDRGGRCRWCGRVGQVDLHHVDYRRGASYDRDDNLISLCRLHHGFVHGVRSGGGPIISKRVAQLILAGLIQTPGQTGAALWRNLIRQWEHAGLCRHGDAECLDCR